MKFWLSQAPAVIPSNKPIIFWDTCALLDILRIPMLGKKSLDYTTLQSYERIEAGVNGGYITSLTSDLVLKEFGAHADNIVNQLAQQEQQIKDEVTEKTKFMKNRPLATAIVAKIYLLDIQNRVIHLVKRILKQTYILKSQMSFAMNADYRVRNYIKPSGGKESYKDSYLWISYISLMRKVSPTVPAFFFTTNPADFAENKKSVKLHPNLATELPSSNCVCALNMHVLDGMLRQYFKNNQIIF